MTSHLSSDDILPFHGYRRARADGSGFERGVPDLYASIEHFFHSEKFRGVDEEFRRLLMELPTAREVRKAAGRGDHQIRPDWERIQNRVMAAGIWMKCREHPHVATALSELRETEGIYRFKDHYWGSDRHGVSVGFYGRLLRDVQARLKVGAMRVLITGSRDFSNQFLFSSKLNGFFNRAFPDEVLIACAKGADAMAEAWALENYVPVSHYPLKGGRSRTERDRRNTAMIDLATHLVAFPQGEGGDVADLIALAKSKKIPGRIVKLDSCGRIIKSPPRRVETPRAAIIPRR